MRCKACRQLMRPYSETQLPLVVPLLAAALGVGAEAYLFTIHMRPIAAAIGIVGALGGVLLASLRREGWRCSSCGAGEPLDDVDAAQAEAEEKSLEYERIRSELAGRLTAELQPQIAEHMRPQLEEELRPQIEDDLRPRLAEELREQFEEELRPRLVDEV